jgi:hypothetical protein
MEVNGQLYDPAALSPGVITRYALCMRLGGRQNLPGRFGAEKILFPSCRETKQLLCFPLHSVIRRTD